MHILYKQIFGVKPCQMNVVNKTNTAINNKTINENKNQLNSAKTVLNNL